MKVESENGSSEGKIESGSLWMSLIGNGNLKRFFCQGLRRRSISIILHMK